MTKTKTKPSQSELSRKICLDVILRDARNWWRSGRHRYVRPEHLRRGLSPEVRRENDKIFRELSQSYNDAMMRWYVQQVLKYGGDVAKLPWVKNGEWEWELA